MKEKQGNKFSLCKLSASTDDMKHKVMKAFQRNPPFCYHFPKFIQTYLVSHLVKSLCLQKTT